MRKANTHIVMIYKNRLILRETPRGWAIIVPDQLQIDNFYHGVHIHPDRAVLPIKDCETIFRIVEEHLENEKKIKHVQLRKELGL